MSYFIAKSVKHDKIKNTIVICGGDNNVVPRSEHYYTIEAQGQFTFLDLFLDLMSGSIQFTNSSKLSKKFNEYIKTVKESHKLKFPTKSSIDNYSFYTMAGTLKQDKKEAVENAYKYYVEYIEKPYGLDYKEYFDLYSERWEEFKNYILDTFNNFCKEFNLKANV